MKQILFESKPLPLATKPWVTEGLFLFHLWQKDPLIEKKCTLFHPNGPDFLNLNPLLSDSFFDEPQICFDEPQKHV